MWDGMNLAFASGSGPKKSELFLFIWNCIPVIVLSCLAGSLFGGNFSEQIQQTSADLDLTINQTYLTLLLLGIAWLLVRKIVKQATKV